MRSLRAALRCTRHMALVFLCTTHALIASTTHHEASRLGRDAIDVAFGFQFELRCEQTTTTTAESEQSARRVRGEAFGEFTI